MADFFAKNLFDLEKYAHASLFENIEYVWEALEHLEEYLGKFSLGKIETVIPKGAFLIEPEKISIGTGTVIEPGAYIQGPCIIGANCQIRHGAYIRGNVVIGDGCVIGHNTEIKHSILLDNACAAHFNYVGDSILGNGVNLGAGVKCANLRLDALPISILLNGQKIATRLNKLGLVAGDGAQLGCNAVANPGTILGKNAFCHPCVNIQGAIPSRAIVKHSTPIIIEETK